MALVVPVELWRLSVFLICRVPVIFATVGLGAGQEKTVNYQAGIGSLSAERDRKSISGEAR
ncbi:hypothetical protein HEQ62_02100 [Haematospirillum jordaniae]|uniref:Uncharacterized protein n=1 Tax=Haematospirillum jordaniae TaxID=1549855 RepID=A0A143DFP3_9PROT|nr:hypothetical protein [Haematospirillum jordaniae]AMW35103.1 hypothetical protein AY555_07865 [Haematospirillum jordaniae]NKD44138.1 hypothetical protein [Haematospirillum jordaniae]NKD56516.1 hypothetical protein [Haematospirillum jordaniae]NKD58574.1 hypothetical protein [Haematospirillum jordaniae]NKD66257.1 hypothetical protein [Haematospirillum jordaniae]